MCSWLLHLIHPFSGKGGRVEEYQIHLQSAVFKIMSGYQSASVTLAVVAQVPTMNAS